MRFIFLAIFFATFSICSSSQQFRFVYDQLGLGSNLGYESDPFVIADSTLTYEITEYTKRYDKVRKDTVWDEYRKAYNVPFRQSSKDSILALVKGQEGKYIYNSNPHIMSGGIDRFYVAYRDWCTRYELKNTADTVTLQLARIINTYLPEGHRITEIYPFHSSASDSGPPIIRDCSATPAGRTYRDVLGDDFDMLRKKGEEERKNGKK